MVMPASETSHRTKDEPRRIVYDARMAPGEQPLVEGTSAPAEEIASAVRRAGVQHAMSKFDIDRPAALAACWWAALWADPAIRVRAWREWALDFQTAASGGNKGMNLARIADPPSA